VSRAIELQPPQTDTGKTVGATISPEGVLVLSVALGVGCLLAVGAAWWAGRWLWRRRR